MDATVTFLLENVRVLQLKSYVDVISGVRNELKQLMKELDYLKSILQEAAKYPKGEISEVWEREIRKVVYDAEDTIDSCLTMAAEQKAKRRRLLPTDVSRFVKQFKSLRETKVAYMLETGRMLFPTTKIGDGSCDIEEPWRKMRKIMQNSTVGFKDDEGVIFNCLKEEREELDIISIIGMPGLGESKLAQNVYQNENIQYEFPIRIWVYVSQDFNLRDAFISILKGFTSQDLSSLRDDDLTQTLSACLEKAKFLLVFDNVWKVEAWNAIQCILPKSNRISKVLITSHDSSIGRSASVNREPYVLRYLTPAQTWEVLQLKVFGKVDVCPQELQNIGKCIAQQCDGQPLIVELMGGILADQFSTTRAMDDILNGWKNVSENLSRYVKEGSENRISNIVQLSYSKLHRDLIDCFLYLGVFPEDHEIPVWTLTRLWIAEGFVQRKPGQSLEETAEENLSDLIDRNLVMIGKTSPTGEVKTCRVHGVIREFCKYRASITDQNLFKEIKKFKEGVFEPSLSNIYEYRRLCIHFHVSEFLSKFLSGKLKNIHVRSFLCFCKETVVLQPKYISAVFDAFKLLRVMDSKCIKFTHFPKKFTKLIHLRYITLSCVDISVLPEVITELWDLQTLVVETMSRTLEIRGNIWSMMRLRHLKTKAAIILSIQGKGEAGENLQTLSRLSPEHCTPDVFRRACNLKLLGVRGNLAILLKNCSSFVNLDCLETLKLQHDLSYQLASENPLPSLPPPNCFPRYIKRLTLSATFLDWKHMSFLAMIGTLEVLKLKDRAFMGISWKAVGAGFPRLQSLLIEKTDLVTWEASDDHFPSLYCLVLKKCEKLSNIPMDLAKSLEILSIEHVPKGAVGSARKIEELKKQKQARCGGFKLDIGPGCE